MHNILAEWKQGTKMATSYSSRRDITFDVPQGLILRPLLFNIFLYELVFLMKDMDFVSQADQNAPYSVVVYIDQAVPDLDDTAYLFLNGSYTSESNQTLEIVTYW